MSDTQNLRQDSLHNLLMKNGCGLNEVNIEILVTSAQIICT